MRVPLAVMLVVTLLISLAGVPQASGQAALAPGVVARINSGGPEVTTPDGTVWDADRLFTGGTGEGGPYTPVAGTDDDVLYQDERWGASSYAIPVPAAGVYTVRLHFAEMVFTGGEAGLRRFGTNLEGGPVELTGYDINAAVGATTADVKAYAVQVDDGILDIEFLAEVEQPLINAIEVLTGDQPPPPSDGVVARINSGGPEVTTPDGTVWDADRLFTGGTGEGGPYTPVAGTDDDVLYQDERWGASSYAIPVPAAGVYTVRLHFAEMVFTGGEAGLRRFGTNLEGGPVELTGYDINAAVGATTADVKAYAVQVDDGILDIEFLAEVEQPLINAIEVVSGALVDATASPSTSQTLTINEPTLISLELSWDDPDADLTLQLNRPDGQVAELADTTSRPERITTHLASQAGDWELRVTAKSGATRYTVAVTTQAETGPEVVSSTHPDPTQTYPLQRFAARWQPSGGQGASGYAVVVDQQPTTEPAAVVIQHRAELTADLPAGQHWLHVRAQRVDGTWGPTSHFGVQIDARARWSRPAAGALVWETATVSASVPADVVADRIEARPVDGEESDPPWRNVGPAAPTGTGTGMVETIWATAAPDAAGAAQWPDGGYELRLVDSAGQVLLDGLAVQVGNAVDAGGRVEAAYASGDLTVDDGVLLGLYAAANPNLLPAEYRTAATDDGPHSASAPALLARWDDLQPATQQAVTRFLTPQPTPQAPPTPPPPPYWDDCLLGGQDMAGTHYHCVTVFTYSGGFALEFVYNIGGSTGVDAVDGTPGFQDNHVPDDVDEIAANMEEAWRLYRDELGFDVPDHPIRVVLSPYPPDDGLAVPDVPGLDPTIWFGIDGDEYLARHEFFHHVQYEYIDVRRLVSLDFDQVNWWMEATAEWATHELNPHVAQDTTRYAFDLPAVLGRPDRAVNHTLPGVAWPDRYGSFIFAEFLDERFGPALVEDTWERIGTARRAPLPVIADIAARRGSSFGREIEAYRQWSYVLDRGTFEVGFDDPEVDVWRNRLQEDTRTRGATEDQARPARTAGKLTSAPSRVRLADSGASYTDLWVDGQPPAEVRVTVNADDPGIRASLLVFSDYPTLCRAPIPVPLTEGAGEVTVALEPGCSDVTLVQVDTDLPGPGIGGGGAAESTIQTVGPSEHFHDVAVAADGSAYVLGSVTSGTLELGAREVSAPAGRSRLFIAKRSAAGVWLWIAASGDYDGYLQDGSLAADGQGVTAAGQWISRTHTLPLAGAQLPGGGIITRANADGTWAWASSHNGDATAIAPADGGGWWIAGQRTGPFVYNGAATNLDGPAGSAGLLARINGDGTLATAHELQAADNPVRLDDLAAAADGTLYIAGSYQNYGTTGERLAVNGYTLPLPVNGCEAGYAGLVAAFDPDTAAFTWALGATGSASDCFPSAELNAVAVDPASGNLLVAGLLRAGATLIDATGNTSANLDVTGTDHGGGFLAAIEPAGSDRGGQSWGTWTWQQPVTPDPDCRSVSEYYQRCTGVHYIYLAADDDGIWAAATVEGGLAQPQAVTLDNRQGQPFDTDTILTKVTLNAAAIGQMADVERIPSPATADSLTSVAAGPGKLWLTGPFYSHNQDQVHYTPTPPAGYQVPVGGYTNPLGSDAFLTTRTLP